MLSVLKLKYTNLPGLINDRFFKIIDENGDEFIDQKEFIHAMFKVYYSKLESKIKLVFDMYLFIGNAVVMISTATATYPKKI